MSFLSVFPNHSTAASLKLVDPQELIGWSPVSLLARTLNRFSLVQGFADTECGKWNVRNVWNLCAFLSLLHVSLSSSRRKTITIGVMA